MEEASTDPEPLKSLIHSISHFPTQKCTSLPPLSFLAEILDERLLEVKRFNIIYCYVLPEIYWTNLNLYEKRNGK